ncbi:MAG: hypothetical protein J6386_14910 [Candidatus Synoicihabitans palmerolidicus]|nr:hypothetical protein [Candidatus Synoicihabitans palmerolidicus]
MSDEPEPPALKLRPRKKPQPEESAVKTPAEPAAGADAFSLKLKRKPSLQPAVEENNETIAPTRLEAPSAEPAKARVKPRLTLKVDDDAKTEAKESEAEVKRERISKKPETSIEHAQSQSAAVKDSAKPRLSLKSAGFSGRKESEKPVEPRRAPVENALKSEGASDGDTSSPVLEAGKPRLKLSWALKEKSSKEGDAPKEAVEPPLPPAPKPKPISPPMSAPGVPSVSQDSSVSDVTLTPPVPVVKDGEVDSESTVEMPELPPPPGLVRDSGDGEDEEEDVVPRKRRRRPEQSPVFKIAVMVVGVLLLGLMLTGGYMAYSFFMGGEEPAPQVAEPAAPVAPPVENAAQSMGWQVD